MKRVTEISVNEVKQAIRVILSDKKNYEKSLNYAIDYCNYAMEIGNMKELQMQCLYILNNLSGWRHPQAKEVREILKKFSNSITKER